MADFTSIEKVYIPYEQKKTMKILVIGSSGWIGGYVVKELLKRPDIEVIAPISVGSFPKIADERVTYITGRVANIETMPDAIIYLAWPDLDYYDSINHLKFIADSYTIIKGFVDRGVRNITVTGTCFEYGQMEGELVETMAPNPTNNYGIAKDTLRRALSNSRYDLKWLRLFYLYGDGQRKSSLIPTLEQAVRNGEKKFVISGGAKVRDYLPIEIAAEYIVKCAVQTKVTGIINVCSGEPITIKSFLESYIKDKGYDMEIGESIRPHGDYGAFSFWGNNERLKRIIK